MGLGQALTSAVSGLRVTQSGLSLIASNIANAETPGYVKKTATQVAAASGDLTIGGRPYSITRELDQCLQRQLRQEQSGGAYATQRSDFFRRLQSVFGQPGENNALETVFNNFTSAVQALSTSPDSSASRYGVLTAGQTLAQHPKGMTADIPAPTRGGALGPHGAATPRHDRRHPGAAQRRRARPLRRGQPGECGAAQHCGGQSAARPHQCAGRDHRDAEGPARLLHRPALATD